MTTLRIPKKLHFIWVGSPMPDHLADNVYQWRKLHPDWQCHVWKERNLPELRNQDLFDKARELVPPDAVEQFRADLARYELLYDIGGFYADVDTRPMRSIEPALDGVDVFAANEDRNWVGNTYLGAVPGHRIFKDLVSGLAGNVRRLRGRRPNHLSGPRYLTPIWRTHGGYTAPTSQWFPYSYTNVKNGSVPETFGPDVYAVHQWHHTKRVMDARRTRQGK